MGIDNLLAKKVFIEYVEDFSAVVLGKIGAFVES